jgi:hypothetical protein
MTFTAITILFKILSFFHALISKLERSFKLIRRGSVGDIDEDSVGVGSCQRRLDSLESVVKQINRHPLETPAGKEHVLLDSFDRIRSLELDLEQTKKVGARFYNP